MSAVSEEERSLLQWLERQLYSSEEERSLLQWLERQLYSSKEERSLCSGWRDSCTPLRMKEAFSVAGETAVLL